MSLPDDWVDRIFTKLSLVYGRDFLSRWEGLELDDVKADWAHELSGMAVRPDRIKYALEHLPASKPPTVLEFRAICMQAQFDELPALPAPSDPVALAAGLQRLKETAAAMREAMARRNSMQ